MKEKKLQVFVSSTFTDLIEERQAAVEAILSSGNIPAGMELFSAADESQMTIIKRWIDESDIYMLILGARYGSIESKSGKSYTQLEYEYAIEQNKPLFAVILNENFIDEKVKTAGKSVLENDNGRELKEFKSLVTTKMVKFCDDKKDIKIAIHETLSEFSYRKELIGWIRGDNSINSSLLADEIARLTKENSELRNAAISNQEAKYNGLSYHELKKLILSEYNQLNNKTISIFEFIWLNGDEFSGWKRATTEESRIILRKLRNYKILKSNSEGLYTFTDDGHKFYLRSLIDEEV